MTESRQCNNICNCSNEESATSVRENLLYLKHWFGLNNVFIYEIGGKVVKMLCFKSEGRWFDPSWCHWNFSLTQNPSDRTMALGSTQRLTEMSTRRISWGGNRGRCVRLTTLPPSWAVVMKSANRNFLESSGPLQACNGTALRIFVFIYKNRNTVKSTLNLLQCSYDTINRLDNFLCM